MIKVDNLTFDYQDKRALNNVSFEIQEGSITALVGPNGSGKTTLLRCLAALSKPLTGKIEINGLDVSANPREAHLQIGYLQDIFGLYDQLTVMQSLNFIAYNQMILDNDIDASIKLAAERAEVEDFKDRKISTLSRGMRQRVGIAQAIIHKPKVLLLDEPASGLDPEARYSLSKLLVELSKKGMTIIVSSHILAELEDYSTEMLVIQDGQILEQHSLLNNEQYNSLNIQIGLDEQSDNAESIMKAIYGVEEVTFYEGKFILKINTDLISKKDLLKKLNESDLFIEEFSELKVNLQNEYIKTVSNHKQKKEQ